MRFDLDAYLGRLGLSGPTPGPTAEGLATLQSAQLGAVTFENLDPFLGVVPDLDPRALVRKIVHGGRGGYCFELNGLFAQALIALGFAVTPVLARVLQRMPDSARSHLAFLVRIGDEEWLADAGFGGPGARVPLRVEPDRRQEDGRAAYRMVERDGEWLLQIETGAGWSPLYQFDRARVSPMDVAGANFLCARWEMAPFRSNLLMARQTPGRRVSLFNRAMKLETARGAIEERSLSSLAALSEVLAGPFGLDVPAEMAARAWERLSER